MSNICAAIGLGQLNILSDRVIRKREIFNTYRNKLSKVKERLVLKEPKESFSRIIG